MAVVPDARQTLRWMLRKARALTPALDLLLAAALEDVDWELRATAMLGTGLFGASRHLARVGRLEWRPDLTNGPTRFDAGVLRVWQEAIVRHAPVHRVPPRNHETLLLYALLNPLEGVDAATHPHRPGYRFVPPVPHWLGDDRPDWKSPNPIRRYVPAAGFWLSERRAGHAVFREVQRFAAEQARASGLSVRLPTADEWEAAARGSDARLFPWGNGYQPGFPALPSPWGLDEMMCGPGEWCIASLADPTPVLCGASTLTGVAARVIETPPETEAGFRFRLA